MDFFFLNISVQYEKKIKKIKIVLLDYTLVLDDLSTIQYITHKVDGYPFQIISVI